MFPDPWVPGHQTQTRLAMSTLSHDAEDVCSRGVFINKLTVIKVTVLYFGDAIPVYVHVHHHNLTLA